VGNFLWSKTFLAAMVSRSDGWHRLLSPVCLEPIVQGKLPVSPFIPAVLLAAWYGRLGPGLFALGLGWLLADLFFIPPTLNFGGYDPAQFYNLAVYLLTGFAALALIERSIIRKANSSRLPFTKKPCRRNYETVRRGRGTAAKRTPVSGAGHPLARRHFYGQPSRALSLRE